MARVLGMSCGASFYGLVSHCGAFGAICVPFGCPRQSFWPAFGSPGQHFGSLGTDLGIRSERNKINRPKGSNMLVFLEPFLDTFSSKSGSGDPSEGTLEHCWPNCWKQVPIWVPQGLVNSAPAAAGARLALFDQAT